MLKITILISKDYDIDIYKISRYIAKTVVLLSPNVYLAMLYNVTIHPEEVGHAINATKNI